MQKISDRSFWVGFIFIGIALATESVLAYNDESPMMKWSPKYLFGGPNSMQEAKSVYSHENTYPRFARFDRFYGLPRGVGQVEGSLGSRNPGFYSRPVRGVKRSTCVADTETCLYRSGLVGAVIKLPCCPGSVCAYKGTGFTCMPKDNLIEESREDEVEEYANNDESLY